MRYCLNFLLHSSTRYIDESTIICVKKGAKQDCTINEASAASTVIKCIAMQLFTHGAYFEQTLHSERNGKLALRMKCATRVHIHSVLSNGTWEHGIICMKWTFYNYLNSCRRLHINVYIHVTTFKIEFGFHVCARVLCFFPSYLIAFSLPLLELGCGDVDIT